MYKFVLNNININIKMESKSNEIVDDKYNKTNEEKNNDEIKNLEYFIKSDNLMYQELFNRKNQSINIKDLYHYLNNEFERYAWGINKTYISIKNGFIGNDNNNLNKRPEWIHSLLHIYHDVIRTIIVKIEKNSCADIKCGIVKFKTENINFTDEIVNSQVFKECILVTHKIITYITKFISIKIDVDQVIKYYKIIFHQYEDSGPFIEWHIVEDNDPEDEKKFQEETFVIISHNISEQIMNWLDVVDKKFNAQKIISDNINKIILGKDIDLLNETKELDMEARNYYKRIEEFCKKEMVEQINKKINYWNIEIEKKFPLKFPHLKIPLVDLGRYLNFGDNRLRLSIIIETN